MAAQTKALTDQPPRDPRRALGARGEDLAAAFFIRRGFRVLARNWRAGRIEIDLVILKDNEVRIVEVKTRKSLGAGYPEEAITDKKLSRLAEAADRFLEERPALPRDAHFDVLAIVIGKNGVPVFQHIRDIE